MKAGETLRAKRIDRKMKKKAKKHGEDNDDESGAGGDAKQKKADPPAEEDVESFESPRQQESDSKKRKGETRDLNVKADYTKLHTSSYKSKYPDETLSLIHI